jgi:acetoin utilization deacetylase AcuC-like enzyme
MVADSKSFSPSAKKPEDVVESWKKLGLPLEFMVPERVSVEALCRAHEPDYVRAVLDGRRPNGFGNTDARVAASLPFTSGSMLSAARWALENGGFAAAPCSGFHHARYGSGGGFCTFNGLMVTVQALLDSERAARVCIVDCDAHYGDGTDDILDHLGLHESVPHFTLGRSFHRPHQASAFFRALETFLDEQA